MARRGITGQKPIEPMTTKVRPNSELIREKLVKGLKYMSDADRQEIFLNIALSSAAAAAIDNLTYSPVFTLWERPIIFVHTLQLNGGGVVDINMAFYRSSGLSRFTGLDGTWLPTLGVEDYKSKMLIKAEEYFLLKYYDRNSLTDENVNTQEVQDLLKYKRFITQHYAMVSYYLGLQDAQLVPVRPEYTDIEQIKGIQNIKTFAPYIQPERVVLAFKRGGGENGAKKEKKRPPAFVFKPDVKLDFAPLGRYYDFKLDVLGSRNNIRKTLLGRGADKEVYLIDTTQGPKAEALFKNSSASSMLKMVETHLFVLKKFLEMGGEQKYSFRIPKLYKSNGIYDNPSEMIMDIVPNTCLKRTSKIYGEEAVVQEFLAFCADIGVNPIDVEYCVDDDGQIYFFDFGNIKIKA